MLRSQAIVCALFLSRVAFAADVALTMEGNVYVHSVDTKRIVIAVDKDNDGTLDDIFLYSSNERLKVRLDWWSIPATVSYMEGGYLTVMPTAATHGAPGLKLIENKNLLSDAVPDGNATFFENTAGLRHHIPAVPISVADFGQLMSPDRELLELKKTAECDVSPQTCFSIAGQILPFPG